MAKEVGILCTVFLLLLIYIEASMPAAEQLLCSLTTFEQFKYDRPKPRYFFSVDHS